MHFNNIRKFVIPASLSEVTDDKSLDEILKAAEDVGATEAAAIITPEGKPRMLILSAWMVHEGRNLNGAAFVAEELKKRVDEGLFRPPYGGMVDFDHDFNPVGFWYKTSYAFNTAANKWGILAQGAIWAWRFPELSDKMLAQMHEEGKIHVSMSVIGESEEITKSYPGAEDRYTLIIHNPVFLTTSLLDVPPADPNATGVVGTRIEDIEHFANMLSNSEKEKIMDLEKQIAALDAELAGLRVKMSEAEAKLTEYQQSITSLQKELDAEKVSKASVAEELTKAQESLKSTQNELEKEKTAKAAVEVSLASTVQAFDELKGQFSEAQTQLEAFKAAQVADKVAELLASRLTELPEVVRENLERHEDKEKILASFSSASEEEWARMKTVFAVASVDKFIHRSNGQKSLLNGANADHQSSLSRFLR